MSAFQQDFKHFEKSFTVTRFDKQLKAIGILGWTLSYIFVILAHQHTNFSLLSAPVLAYNIVWEGFKTMLWNKEEDARQLWLFGVGWFGLDLIIISKFWMDGDGSDSSIEFQRVKFILYVILYSSISSIIHLTKSQSTTRIWRHASYTLSWVIQLEFIQYYLKHPYPYIPYILIGSSIGNILCIASVQKGYEQWYFGFRYPVRFILYVTQFIPAIVGSLYGIYFVIVL